MTFGLILSIWSNDKLESFFRSTDMMQTSFSIAFLSFYLLSFCHGAPLPAFLRSVLSGNGMKEESRVLKRSGMFNFTILPYSSLYLRYMNLLAFLNCKLFSMWLSPIHAALLPELIEIFKLVENRHFTEICNSSCPLMWNRWYAIQPLQKPMPRTLAVWPQTIFRKLSCELLAEASKTSPGGPALWNESIVLPIALAILVVSGSCHPISSVKETFSWEGQDWNWISWILANNNFLFSVFTWPHGGHVGTIAKKVFDSITTQNLSDILPLLCAPTWPWVKTKYSFFYNNSFLNTVNASLILCCLKSSSSSTDARWNTR